MPKSKAVAGCVASVKPLLIKVHCLVSLSLEVIVGNDDLFPIAMPVDSGMLLVWAALAFQSSASNTWINPTNTMLARNELVRYRP